MKTRNCDDTEQRLRDCGWRPSKARHGVWVVVHRNPKRVPYAHRYAFLPGSWDDHGRLYHRAADDCYMYVTEPYPQGADGLRDLFDFCEQWDLTATVEACPSIHNPGGCLHIRILPNGKQWGRP